ncbi:PREDICTED: uncharacterized protein LOC109167485 [Ipomoea nil]|uniref:uncharacterized protein LOC109167485 n=1 Tax=Ipomoea nil TaxID=35883 RepID=UPI000901EBFF|nr:PREDICTED: uncharacterized protein LOC109167485 [Ipomoea nil]XP_019172045.1 PREDICTED: uncharacterized protein LOC109167485 [Ipomoea nil]XP_019172046.1 PREDICTED: uncharacterized protein LOC109167485 [Ipomoea nil]
MFPMAHLDVQMCPQLLRGSELQCVFLVKELLSAQSHQMVLVTFSEGQSQLLSAALEVIYEALDGHIIGWKKAQMRDSQMELSVKRAVNGTPRRCCGCGCSSVCLHYSAGTLWCSWQGGVMMRNGQSGCSPCHLACVS